VFPNTVLTLVGDALEGEDHYARPPLFDTGKTNPDFLNASLTFFSLSKGVTSIPASLMTRFLVIRSRNIQLQFIITSSFSQCITHITIRKRFCQQLI
jgi:hypothetical protein